MSNKKLILPIYIFVELVYFFAYSTSMKSSNEPLENQLFIPVWIICGLINTYFVVYGINGLSQGGSWPMGVACIANWFPKSQNQQNDNPRCSPNKGLFLETTFFQICVAPEPKKRRVL